MTFCRSDTINLINGWENRLSFERRRSRIFYVLPFCLETVKISHINVEKIFKFVDGARRKWKRQWNKWLLTAVALTGILVFTWYAGNWARIRFGSAQEAAADIMKQLDFQEKECNLAVEYDCTKADYTEDEQWKLLMEIAGKLGLTEPLEKQEVITQAGTSFALVKTGVNSEVTLKIVTLFGAEEESVNPVQYLFLNLYLSGNYEDAIYYQACLKKVLQEENISAEIKSEFKGVLSIDKKEELKSWKQALLKTFDAKIVSENDSGSTDIIYAYSPMIATAIQTAKGDVNLNIIIKQVTELNKMEVRVAIPAVYSGV